MKKIIFMVVCFVSMQVQAQVTRATLVASGLTCSMCSNSINKSLKTVDYIDKVTANIRNSSFDIVFKPGAAVNFDELKKKVEDAGFFVARLSVTLAFDHLAVQNDEHVRVNGMWLHFVNVKPQELNGEKEVQILDKGFVSAKQFKKNQALSSMECFKTGVTASCCQKAGVPAGTRIYHITI
jgi:copper chaperone CopZ